MLAIFLLPIAGYFILSSDSVQHKLINKLSRILSKEMSADVTIRDINISPGFKFTIHDVCIKVWNDTIIYAREVSTSIEELDIKKGIFHFGSTELIKGYMHLKEDSIAQKLNLEVILDKLEEGPDDPSTPSTFILFDDIKTIGSAYRMTMCGLTFDPRCIDFGNLDVSNINAKIDNLKVFKGHFTMNTQDLSFNEHSGFMVNRMNYSMFISKSDMRFEKVNITTPYSDLRSENLYFHASSFKQYVNFLRKVKLDYKFNKSRIGFRDIAYFMPEFLDNNEKFTFSGQLIGTIVDFKAKKIKINYGSHTTIEADGNMNGMPDLMNTYCYLNIRKFHTHNDDLQQLVGSFTQPNPLILPVYLARLGEIEYSGNYTGFINDFVAYGNFVTDLGSITTDLMIKPQSKSNILFQGFLQTAGFNLGAFVQNNMLGTLDMNLQLNGTNYDANHELFATIEGTIRSIQFNKYAYQNIQMIGNFSKSSFSGSVFMDDPNIKLDFNGSLDFSKAIPEHHFYLDVRNANLYKLNFVRKDTAFTLGCQIKADFKGNNIDSLNGNVTLLNAKFHKTGQNYQLKNAVLSVSSSSDSAASETIDLASELVDIRLQGRYDFHTLIPSFKDIINKYMSNLMPEFDSSEAKKNDNNFNFTAFFKKTKPVTSFFIPDLQIADNTFLNGTFNPEANDVSIAVTGDYLNYKTTQINNLTFFTKTSDSLLEFSLGCDKLSVGERLQFNRIYISSIMNQNNIATSINWKKDDTVTSAKEHISFNIGIAVHPEKNQPVYNIQIDSSDFSIMNERWQVSTSQIQIDSSSIAFNTFHLRKDDQFLKVAGKISKSPTDTFSLFFSNLNLSNLNLFLDKDLLLLDGMANGQLHLLNVYKNPMLFTDMKIDHFTLNHEDYGNSTVSAHWIENEKKISISSTIGKGTQPVMEIAGAYYPSNHNLNFSIQMNKFKISPLAMYLEGVLSKLEGVSTGTMTLTGTTENPLLNGKMNLQRGSFLVDYLQTKYSITSTPLDIENNKFIIRNTTVNDENGKEAKVQASLFANRLRDFYFDVQIDANDFTFMNLTETDNIYFYGKAYGTGIVKISGTPSSMTITVNAKTTKNTKFSIPFSTGDIEEKKFITFVSKKQDQESSDELIDKKVTQATTSSGLIFNLNIEATPDAEVELILDPIIGDAITATGSGTIQLEMDNLGKFKMYGRYNVDEGDYRFSLKSLMVKHFKIDKGGVIEWHGDPLDASVDLKTIYRTRASLTGVLPDIKDQTSQTRVPVECWLYLTGKLLNPTLKYDIYLPSSTEETRTKLRTVLTPEELPRQFIWLLVTNTFYTDPSRANNTQAANASSTGASLDMLSSQFNSLLGKNPLDLAVMMSSGSAEVGMSRQLLNDRVSISGNFDYYYGNQTNTGKVDPNAMMLQNKILGDVNLDVKITEDGKFRFKAFNRANDQYAYTMYDQALHKQGVGLMYQEEFNSVGELISSFWNKIFKKDKTKK